MNYFIYAQQNQPILEVQNQKGYIYQLRNEQYIDSALTRYEGEMEDQKRRILCDRLQNYTDELMRCLNELIENPQENILNYMDFFIDPYTRHLFIIYEYVEKEQCLNNLIYSNALDSARKLQFCNDIAKGIYHLHQICYRHRNVNPENIFYINGKFKLANLKNVVHFVMSEQLDFVGDSDYWSQELFQGLEQDHTIDIFAFACTLFEVFTKEKLFSNQHNDRQRIPQDKKQKLQEIPSNVQRFINQVIEENQRDLKLFLVDQALDKKQTQHPGNSVQKQFQFQTNQLFINNNNDNNNKMKQTLPSFNQTNQIRPQTATLQSTIQNQIGTFKLPFQVKQPDPQLNTFQQQMPQQPQSNQYVQQQQQQNQQFQQQFQQKSQQPFQQQQFQQQSFQQSQTFKQGPISQPKFKILDKPFSQGNQQQQQFFPNAPQPSNQQQFQQQVQVFDTYQVEEVNQKKNDIQQNDLQQFNPNQQEQKNEEDFQNQQSNKKENEVENFKIMILNQIQKIVKYEQIENILQNTIQLKNENQDFSIEHILSKIITRKVRNSLGIQSDQIV